MNSKSMNDALNFLRDKYACPEGVIETGAEYALLRMPDGQTVNLLPWRVERRITELKKIIDGGTLEHVSTFRFASFRPDGDLARILARELDLAIFLSGSTISRIFTVTAPGGKSCNAIFRLANGMSGCVECGITLPAGAAPVDRHEIIAMRGVASDRTVDTQVPQESIYQWTADGIKTYTDVDTELFGLSNDEIWVVRAAYAVLMNPALREEWNNASREIIRITAAALESGKTGQPVSL